MELKKGGLNNEWDNANGMFDIGHDIWFIWHLTEFKLDDIIGTMNHVASRYDAYVEKPINEGKCITLHFKNELIGE